MQVKKGLAVAGAALMLAAGVGCSTDTVAENEVLIWAITGSDNAAWLAEMEREFEADNPEIGIVVRATFADYNSILTSFARGNSPDIVYVDDEYFKRYADGGFIEPLDQLIEEYWSDSDIIDVGDMWEPALSRYRYETSNNTSDADDPLWCVPKDMDPTVLYYNEGAFRELGITVISVEEDEMGAWNAGEIADANGKYKSDYAGLEGVTVPARGYWRSDGNWESGMTWSAPASGATLVFNNKIPMSWDETEDLAMLCTSSYNLDSPTTYGYYTEWWFNYGWSVGGDCIGDMTGDGDYVFTLNDSAPNYKVLQAVSVNGTDYTPGTNDVPVFLSYEDKQYLAENEAQAAQLVGNGQLEEYPSTLDAFTRFCALSRDKTASDPTGLAVSPKPSAVPTASDALGRFNTDGYLAMFVGYSSSVASMSDEVEWNIAPLPVYKTYTSRYSDEVVQMGARAGHSKSTGLAIAADSRKKEMAMTVLAYLAGKPGQTALAEQHYNLPNTEDVARESYLTGADGKNYEQMLVETRYQDPGDWWYMLDREWIANWSEPLNQNADSVRNSGMTLSDYFELVVEQTNRDLKIYKEALSG